MGNQIPMCARLAAILLACARFVAGADVQGAQELLRAVASTYRADDGVRIEATHQVEVGGYLQPWHTLIELEWAGEDRICLGTSKAGREKTTGCTDGREVGQTLVLGKKEYRRWEVTDPRGEALLRLHRVMLYRYHGRFAELDKAKVMDGAVRYRSLRVGKRTARCAVVRIESTMARRGTAPEDLWIDLETHRVVRTEL